MPTPSNTLRLWSLLATVTIISGLTPVAAAFAIAELPPFTLALVRFGVAGVLLHWTARALRLPYRFAPKDRRLLMLLAAICVPVNQAAFLFGVRYANAAHAGIVYALVPVLVLWLTFVFGTARLTAKLTLATLLAFFGAAFTSSGAHGLHGNGGAAAAGEVLRLLAGDGLLLMAALSWSLFIVLSQDLVRRAGAIQTLAAVFLIGAAMQVPLGIADVLLLDASRFTFAAVTWKGIAGFGFITLITAYTNFLLFYLVIARFDVTRASIVTNASFLVAVLLDAAVTRTTLSPWVAVGSALLLIGIALSREATDSRVRQPSPPIDTADAPQLQTP